MNTRPPGRPPIHGAVMPRVTIHLTSDQYLVALGAGSGNVSRGVRQLLDELAEYRQWHERQLEVQAPAPVPIPRSRHQ